MCIRHNIKKISICICIILSISVSGCLNGNEKDVLKESESLQEQTDTPDEENLEKSKQDTLSMPKEEEKLVPESPAEEIHNEENVVISDPSEAQENDKVTGVDDTDGLQVLDSLSKYGFSVEDGLEAPDGSVSWSFQNGQYSCDIQADADGNIYNAVFTDSGEDYIDFLTDCAGIFSSDAASWIIENANTDASKEIGDFAISVSKGPGGHTLQVCSQDYRNTVVGPEDGGIIE